MDGWQLAALAGCGAACGFINVIAGGGSLLVMPFMVFMGLPGPVANGTNRVAIAAQNLSSIWAFRRKGYAQWKQSLGYALATVPGAVCGALAGVRLEGLWFNRVLAGVMILVLALMAQGSPRRKGSGRPAPRWAVGLALVGAGFYGGFIQAGVGFLLMAILHRLGNHDLVRVNMHKVFIVLVFTLVALPVYAWHGQVDGALGAVLAAGNAAGGWIGSHVQIAKGERWVRRFLVVTVLVMAMKLLLDGASGGPDPDRDRSASGGYRDGAAATRPCGPEAPVNWASKSRRLRSATESTTRSG